MIAEEYLPKEETPKVSISNSSVVLIIQNLMKQTVPHFKSYILSDFYTKRKLNEDELTQIFIEQATRLIRKKDLPFNINSQYRDITNRSKGFSDFYFYPNELDISATSIFSVESKRLPSPEKKREKEYVIGNNQNGGIERYKIEKHGKGLNECGLLGFIENETTEYWLKTINGWIVDLSKSDRTWNNNEILKEIEKQIDYCHLNSIARSASRDISLFHLWIILAKKS